MMDLFANLAMQGSPEMALQMFSQYQQRQSAQDPSRMYGMINPGQHDPESLQAYHENFMRTGQRDFSLLKPRDTFSATEQKALVDAQGKASQADFLYTKIERFGGSIRASGHERRAEHRCGG